MLRMFKKKVVTSPTVDEVKKDVKTYVMAFIINNNIENSLFKDVSIEKEGEAYIVNIKAGQPGKLIGKGGNIANKLTKMMSKHLDIPLSVNVIL
jgi:ribosomal protein S3